MNKNSLTIMSHGWWQESKKAWFVPIKINALFEADMEKKEIKILSPIPEESFFGHRNYLHVVKYGSDVYCIPMYSARMWCCHLDKMSWEEIKTGNKDGEPVLGNIIGTYKNILYIFSQGSNQIWGMDLEKKEITCICGIGETDEVLIRSILVNDNIYFLSETTPRIYVFDLEKKQKNIFELSGIEDQLYNLCFDGRFFWISGRKKKIYIWDSIKHEVEELQEFPKEFGVYEFNGDTAEIIEDIDTYEKRLFLSMVFLNHTVWMIPECGNKVLYCNIKDRHIKSFEIEDEQETVDTLKTCYRVVGAKYLLQYIREERYLGLYSLKNKRILEIDTLRMTYTNVEYEMDAENIADMPFQPVYIESPAQIPFFVEKIKYEQERGLHDSDYGEKIWKSIKHG